MTHCRKPVLGMVLKGFPRISETFISNEIRLLEERGFFIHIISMRKPRENFTHASVKAIKAPVAYLPETILTHLPRLVFHNVRCFAKNPDRYTRALATAARRFRRTRKSATFKHLLQAGLVVDRILPGSGIGHFHAHFAHSPTSVAMFAADLSGLGFSFTAHAKDIYTSDPAQLREKIHKARFVTTCTGYNQKFLERLANGVSTPIHRIYHGIDVRMFAMPAMQEETKPPYQVLTVARMTRKKGLPTVLKAIALLRDNGMDIRHTLIGDGDDREKILKLIDTLGLSDCSRWLGTLPHEKVLEHYRSADLFAVGCEISPNGDRDGIPNVLVEAMAMGVPVVATNVSAIPELVENETSGLLVASKRPEKLAEAMKRLLTETELRQTVIPHARRKVENGFDNAVLIEQLADIHRKNLSDLTTIDNCK